MKNKIILITVIIFIAIQFVTMFTACGNRAWISDSVQNEFNYLVIKEADGEYHIHKIKKWADSASESFTVLTECCGNYIWGSVNNAYLYKEFPEYLHECIICEQEVMKDTILLVKECIAAHACVQTENGNVVGYFLDDPAIDRIANDVAKAMEVEE